MGAVFPARYLFHPDRQGLQEATEHLSLDRRFMNEQTIVSTDKMQRAPSAVHRLSAFLLLLQRCLPPRIQQRCLFSIFFLSVYSSPFSLPKSKLNIYTLAYTNNV